MGGGARIIGWEYDPYEDRFTFVSEKAQEITGYTIEQWSEKGFWASHIHPEDKDFAVRYCKNATKKGKDHELKYRMITTDGGFIWFRDIVHVVLNNGKVTNLRGVLVDITHHKKVEEDLELFKAIIDQTNDAVFVVDSETGSIIDINEEACRSLGYEREEILNMLVENIVASPKEFFWAEFGKLKTKEYMRVEGEHKRKDNTTFPVEVNAKAVAFKDKRYMIAVARDITERKKVEKITREQSKLLDLIFKHSLDSIVLLDKDYNFIRVSETYAKACQRDSSEFPGHNHFEFYPSNFKNEADEAKKGKYIYQKSARPFIFPDHPEWGTTYWDLGLVPILDKEGEIELFLFTLKDVTNRKRAEKKLQEQKKTLEQKNIALNEILGQIEIEKKQIKDNVIANAETLLLPIIEKISLNKESSKYAQLLRENLQELTSSFGTRLSEKRLKLTSREIDICNMIKHGLTSKEIAALLNISLQTIEKHRAHIRKKLGIVNQKLNLASVLKKI